ncbi:MAG: hypothetical protein PWQ55_1533 [Chloroflexota bacterium]|nr:hypothetical protein [Chloroflexota bacterium]
MNIPLQKITRNQLVVLALPRYRVRDIFALIVDVALRGNVRVVDGGNLFNVLTLNRTIRRKTERVDEILRQIYISRAFTCYQMEAMLQNVGEYHCPVFVLDLLYTFYDESVDDAQSQRLLASSIRNLQQVSAASPVLVGLFPPTKDNKRPFLMDMILDAADASWQPEARPAVPQQMELWE